MGNAVGPVTLICLGIFLGYLTLTGRAANLVAFLTSGGNTATPTATTPLNGTNSSSQSATQFSNVPGSSVTNMVNGVNYGILPTGAPGTAAGMSQQQAAAAAQGTLDTYTVPLGN